MDVPDKIQTVLRHARERYAAGAIDRAGMVALARRAYHLTHRHRYLRERRSLAWSSREAEALDGLARLRAAVGAGKTVAAIDVGYRTGVDLEEVGLCVLDPSGVRTVTLMVEGAFHRHPDPSLRRPLGEVCLYKPAMFGPTEILPAGEILARVRAAYAGCDLALFHSMHADIPRIGLLHDPLRVVDTERCAWPWFGRLPSLSEVCARYGIDASGAHNSGNDARLTLDAALAMASDPSLPRLARRRDLIEACDAALRRLVMHPTRAPGREALEEAWRAARHAAGACHVDPAVPALPLPGMRGQREVRLAWRPASVDTRPRRARNRYRAGLLAAAN